MTNYVVSNPGDETPTGLVEAAPRHSFADTNSLSSLLRALIRRKNWIIGSIVICVVLAFVATMMMKPTYDATVTIELNKSTSSSMEMGAGGALADGLAIDGGGLQTDLQTEIAILKDDTLALAVIQRLGLATQAPFASKGRKGGNDPEKGLPLEKAPRTRSRLLTIFGSHLKVTPVRGTRLIRVTFESHDPVQAAQIANALIDSYKSQYLQSHYDASNEVSQWLTKQLSDLKANVEESEKKLTDFEKKSGILSLDVMSPAGAGGDSSTGGGGGGIHSVVIQKLDALNAELTAAEADRIEKEAIYHLAQSGNPEVVAGIGEDTVATKSNSMVLTQGGGVTILQGLQRQKGELQLNLAQMSTTYGPNNRHLQEVEAQIGAVDRQIHQELIQITKRAQADYELSKQTEDGIRRQFDEQQVAAGKLNENAVEFAVLSQEAYSRKRLYEDLYTKLQEANVSTGIKATNITIVDPARPQATPIRPKRSTNLALGLLVGILLGLTATYVTDSLDRTLRSPLEVEEITGIPVVGVIPSFEKSDKPYGILRGKEKNKEITQNPQFQGSAWMLTHPESSAAEAFRALRTSIMISRPGGGPKVILVTSCIPEEGKTTVTSNFAIAFAQHDKRVIIVEADMRRPRMTHTLNVSNKVGLSNVLAGTHTIDQATLRGVQVPTLDVMPAGPHPPMPSEMLGSSAFDELLQQLRSRYDIVIIDSPPALLVTDAVSISMKSDVTVWVVRAGTVTRPQLARASSLIERNGMPVIGFIVNRMTRSLAGSAYGYGYEYEYGNYGSYYAEKNSDEV